MHYQTTLCDYLCNRQAYNNVIESIMHSLPVPYLCLTSALVWLTSSSSQHPPPRVARCTSPDQWQGHDQRPDSRGNSASRSGQ